MKNESDVQKIIQEINATKRNRKYCISLHQTLSSDGYVRSIVNWTRVTKPERIDALVEHIEKCDAEVKSLREQVRQLTEQRDAVVNMFGEIKEITGFKHRYFITSKGYMFSLASGKLKQLTPSARGKDRNKYLFVRFERDGKIENVTVHRMVADHFLGGKPSPELVINHKDGNKQNNNAENLEWVTLSQNIQHAYDNGLAGGIRHGAFKGPICAERDDGFGYVMFGTRQIKASGFDPGSVSNAIRRGRGNIRGFRFSRLTTTRQLRESKGANHE